MSGDHTRLPPTRGEGQGLTAEASPAAKRPADCAASWRCTGQPMATEPPTNLWICQTRNCPHAIVALTTGQLQQPSKRETYRGWVIDYDPPPIPIRSCDWQFWHQDYDGPEDGRSGHAGSLDEARAEIDMREDD